MTKKSSTITEEVVSNLGEAAGKYLNTVTAGERESAQTEINNFVRWFGRERSLNDLKAQDIAGYADRLNTSDTDYSKKLELLRSFLTYAKKEGWSKINLAVHLKPKKGKAVTGKHGQPESVPVTAEGFAELENELKILKKRRPQIIEDIRRAAADKDFRENSPLAAAREELGHLDGRIQEIESTIKLASIIYRKTENTRKVCVGDNIVLVDLDSGLEMCYSIVGPREADPSKGRISGVSPVGKAILGHDEQDIVEVVVPAGKIHYQIKQINN